MNLIQEIRTMLSNTTTAIAQASPLAHAIAILSILGGAVAAVVLPDPHVVAFFQAHWWAEAIKNTILCAGPPLLVYFRAQKWINS